MSLPPVMRKIYPFHSSPRVSPGTSWDIFLSWKIRLAARMRWISKQSDGTHVFLSSSTSISFWFPVAGSENSQPVSRQCCWPCLLAMLNFILSRGKSARTRHTLAWLKQGLCCTAASATSASSDNYAARIRICIAHHNQGQDYINCEFLAVHALQLLTLVQSRHGSYARSRKGHL